MKFQEEHKQFVVQRYAQFMPPTEIVDTFMIEFQHELHRICEIEKNYENLNIEHFDMYGFPVTEAEIKEYAKRNEITSLSFDMDLGYIQRALREKLLASFRRLNITHSQFPQKYRELFETTREQYFQSYRPNDLTRQENIITELSTLYQLTKELAFEKQDLKSIAQAVQILKTIATCNAINDQQQAVDITPETTKAIQDTAKTLTQHLEKHKEKKNA